MKSYKVGKIIRIEWDQESNDVRIVIEITDDDFKRRVLHGKGLEDIISIKGKNIVIEGEE